VPQAAGANPLLARVDPALGPKLLALPCDLVWATTWESEANECLAPLLGLPQLPVVTWLEPSDEPEPAALHWKTRMLVEWAAGRPFAWLDDEITDADRTWAEAYHPARTFHLPPPRRPPPRPHHRGLRRPRRLATGGVVVLGRFSCASR
jgi:hypothetical protein